MDTGLVIFVLAVAALAVYFIVSSRGKRKAGVEGKKNKAVDGSSNTVSEPDKLN